MDKLYVRLAQLVGAYKRCTSSGNDWAEKHETKILKLVKDHLPSGSGFDSGTDIDLAASSEEKLVFHTHYHHMNDGGMYDGWTDHTVVVKPSLAYGLAMRITGRDRNQIKDYIYECFDHSLREEHDDREPLVKVASEVIDRPSAETSRAALDAVERC